MVLSILQVDSTMQGMAASSSGFTSLDPAMSQFLQRLKMKVVCPAVFPG